MARPAGMWRKNAADASGCRERDRFEVDKLSAVPVHFRKGEHLREQPDDAGLGMVEMNVECAGRIKTRVTVVEIDAALGIEQATVGMNDGRSSKRRAIPASSGALVGCQGNLISRKRRPMNCAAVSPRICSRVIRFAPVRILSPAFGARIPLRRRMDWTVCQATQECRTEASR